MYNSYTYTVLNQPFTIISEKETVLAAGFESNDNLIKQLDQLEIEIVQESIPGFKQAALDYNNGEVRAFEKYSVNQSGTELQNSVWDYLGQLPNETISYKELADAIGKPKAIRAVASACGANKCMLFIPCHRVLRSNGELGGYVYGVATKKQILDHELKHK